MKTRCFQQLVFFLLLFFPQYPVTHYLVRKIEEEQFWFLSEHKHSRATSQRPADATNVSSNFKNSVFLRVFLAKWSRELGAGFFLTGLRQIFLKKVFILKKQDLLTILLIIIIPFKSTPQSLPGILRIRFYNDINTIYAFLTKSKAADSWWFGYKEGAGTFHHSDKQKPN